MIRYQKLGYVGLNVTDIARARRFYEEIVGLQFVETCPDGTVLFRCSDDYHSISLHEAATPGFRFAGLMLESDRQFEVLGRRLDECGIPYEVLSAEECRGRRVRTAWRISEPHMCALSNSIGRGLRMSKWPTPHPSRRFSVLATLSSALHTTRRPSPFCVMC